MDGDCFSSHPSLRRAEDPHPVFSLALPTRARPSRDFLADFCFLCVGFFSEFRVVPAEGSRRSLGRVRCDLSHCARDSFGKVHSEH